MSNEFKVCPVEDNWLVQFGGSRFETPAKFNRPTKDCKYVKILALCLTYATAKMMFPHTEHAIMHMERDMCRHGLLQRYTRKGSRAYWYKTTAKGLKVLEKALRTN